MKNLRPSLWLSVLLGSGLAAGAWAEKPAVAPVSAAPAPAPLVAADTEIKKTADVVYGRKFGFALTMDVFQPAAPNGCAVIYMVSGGWISGWSSGLPEYYKPFLERGYTVFSVRHACQPKFIIPEITQDIHRAIRYIRHNAKTWNLDPEKFGISGGSAGGHLSLTMGVHGGPGDPAAKDPIDRESSAIQAIACLYPPTDFLNYGKPGEDAVGVGILKNYRGAFGSESDTPEGRQRLGREVSPIYHIPQAGKLAPTLIIHGDKDLLVPLQQAETFVQKATEAGATARVVVKKGGAHGWPDRMPDYTLFADWFDQHLRGIQK